MSPEHVRTRAFPQQMRGYNITEVREFLAALASQMSAGTLVSTQIVDAKTFSTSMRGYDRNEVDDFLAAVAAQTSSDTV